VRKKRRGSFIFEYFFQYLWKKFKVIQIGQEKRVLYMKSNIAYNFDNLSLISSQNDDYDDNNNNNNNNKCSTKCKYRTAVTLYTLETWFVSGI
jgi:hypothetical protein